MHLTGQSPLPELSPRQTRDWAEIQQRSCRPAAAGQSNPRIFLVFVRRWSLVLFLNVAPSAAPRATWDVSSLE